MGIHIHREGTPYNCGCCDIRERLMNLYDRTHTAVLDVNGYTPDGEGHLFIPDIQDVTDLREDVEDLKEDIEDLKEGEEGLISAVNQNAQDIRNTRQYADSIGENVAAIDTEIHTTRPYVDVTTFNQKFQNLGHHDLVDGYRHQHIEVFRIGNIIVANITLKCLDASSVLFTGYLPDIIWNNIKQDQYGADAIMGNCVLTPVDTLGTDNLGNIVGFGVKIQRTNFNPRQFYIGRYYQSETSALGGWQGTWMQHYLVSTTLYFEAN